MPCVETRRDHDRTSMKKLKRLSQKSGKLRVFVWKRFLQMTLLSRVKTSWLHLLKDEN